MATDKERRAMNGRPADRKPESALVKALEDESAASLPKIPIDESAIPNPQSEIPNPQSEMIRVLLADDHAVVRDGLRMMLEAQGGITVVGDARDGYEAIRLCQDLSPDVVVMDIAMPGLNGIGAAQIIVEEHPATRIVILSMHATSEHIYRALQAGARGYVLKESAGREVVNAVRAVRAGHRYLSERIAETVIEDYIRQHETPVPQSPVERLSAREREVLQLVVEGQSSAQIAKIIHLSPKTVETYRSRLMEKLEIHDVPSLVKFAIEHGLTTPA